MMLIILKVVLQVLTVMLATLTGVLDYKWHDKRTKRFKTARNLLYLTTGIILLCSIGVTIGDDVAGNRKEAELNARLGEVQEQNKDLLNHQKLALNTITGGDSFCSAYPIITRNKIILSLQLEGTFSLPEVKVSVMDEDFIEKDDSDYNRKEFGPYNLTPYQHQYLADFNLTDSTHRRLIFIISTKYRVFYEEMMFIKTEKGWENAYRVMDRHPYFPELMNDAVIFVSRKSNDFPVQKDGTIKWWGFPASIP